MLVKKTLTHRNKLLIIYLAGKSEGNCYLPEPAKIKNFHKNSRPKL